MHRRGEQTAGEIQSLYSHSQHFAEMDVIATFLQTRFKILIWLWEESKQRPDKNS